MSSGIKEIYITKKREKVDIFSKMSKGVERGGGQSFFYWRPPLENHKKT